MAKAKKTSAKKAIADVAHPGTSAPSDTSKSIITPRPIIKDPMMIRSDAEAASKDEPEKPSLRKAGETRIDPLGEQTGTTAETAETKEAEETKETPDTESAAPETAETEAKAKTETDAQTKPAKHEPGTGTKSETESEPGAADKAVAKDDAKTAKEDADDKAEAHITTENDADDAAKDDAKDDAKNDADDAAKAEEAQAEQEAQLQKLIDSKKYFLPLNAVEHRRSTRFVAIGIILALILAAAWVDIALDAGLIHLNGVKPVTHLFSN